MSLPVLIAVDDAGAEQRLVADFAQADSPVGVSRRCVDVQELLVAAGSGAARAAILSAELRHLDGDVIARLREYGVPVVALARDERAERLARSLKVAAVLPLCASADSVAAALVTVLGDLTQDLRDGPEAPAVPATAAPPVPGGDFPGSDALRPPGTLIAVWGPPGAPGRSLLAASLAGEIALLERSTLLVDADVYAASIAQQLSLLDEVPGLLAAARAANLGALDAVSLAASARTVTLRAGALRILTGLPRADRWLELRPAAFSRVLELARSLCEVVVVDCSACLESDEELAYDVVIPRRNGVTLAALGAADTIVAIGAADPVGVTRLIRGLAELGDVIEGAAARVVVNRVRTGAVRGDVEREVAAALSRFAGARVAAFLPTDTAAADRALAEGQLLCEAAPGSPLRVAIGDLAADLVGGRAAQGRRARRRGRSHRSRTVLSGR